MWQCRSCVCIVFGVPVALVFKVVWYVVCFTRAARTSSPCCFGPSPWCTRVWGISPLVRIPWCTRVFSWSSGPSPWCTGVPGSSLSSTSVPGPCPSRVYQWLVSPPDTKASAAVVVVNHQASQGTQSNTATRGKKLKRKRTFYKIPCNEPSGQTTESISMVSTIGVFLTTPSVSLLKISGTSVFIVYG